VLLLFVVLQILRIPNPLLLVASAMPGGEGGRNPLIVRLHLVRHGETVANRQNYVLGQRESPLTEKGIREAVALGSFIGRRPFWRAYSSDYDRTVKTAGLILSGGDADGGSESLCTSSRGNSVLEHETETQGAEDSGSGVATAAEVATAKSALDSSSPTERVIPDKRLRERAKGVREGRLKTVTFEEALKLYRLENGDDADLPLLESDDAVWDRLKNWIDEVVVDACNDAMKDRTSDGGIKTYKDFLEGSQGQLPSSISDSKGNTYERTNTAGEGGSSEGDLGVAVDPRVVFRNRNIFDVLVVSHSATIRTAVNRLVGDQLPSDIVRGSGGSDGASKGMLIVPNTSRTIVDIIVGDSTMASNDDKQSLVAMNSQSSSVFRANLVELTNTDHLSRVET